MDSSFVQSVLFVVYFYLKPNVNGILVAAGT